MGLKSFVDHDSRAAETIKKATNANMPGNGYIRIFFASYYALNVT